MRLLQTAALISATFYHLALVDTIANSSELSFLGPQLGVIPEISSYFDHGRWSGFEHPQDGDAAIFGKQARADHHGSIYFGDFRYLSVPGPAGAPTIHGGIARSENVVVNASPYTFIFDSYNVSNGSPGRYVVSNTLSVVEPTTNPVGAPHLTLLGDSSSPEPQLEVGSLDVGDRFEETGGHLTVDGVFVSSRNGPTFANADVEILSGGRLQSGDSGTVANLSSSPGQSTNVTIEGVGAGWHHGMTQFWVAHGGGGEANLIVSDQGALRTDTPMLVGNTANGGRGTVLVDGGTADLRGLLVFSDSKIKVAGQGKLRSDFLLLSPNPSDVTSLEITGHASEGHFTDDLSIGGAGKSTVVTRDFADLEVGGNIQVGLEGIGQLDIFRASSLTGSNLFLGTGSESQGTLNVTGTSRVSLNEALHVGGDGTGEVKLTHDSVASTSSLHVSKRGTVVVDETSFLQVGLQPSDSSGSGVTIMQDGVLTGGGTIKAHLTNHGYLAPGDFIGAMTIDGGFNQTTGLLEIELGDTDQDRLEIQGHAELGGTLALLYADDFIAPPGRRFPILTADSVGGMFDEVHFPDQRAWQLEINSTAGRVFALIPAIGGDLNGDGDVNFGDLTQFVLALSDPERYTEDFPWLDRIQQCDTNGDGACNFGDLAGFVDLLVGTTGAHQQTIPEPKSISVLAVAIVVLVLCGRPPQKTPCGLNRIQLTPEQRTLLSRLLQKRNLGFRDPYIQNHH